MYYTPVVQEPFSFDLRGRMIKQATNYLIVHTHALEFYNTVNWRYLDVGNNESIFISASHTTLFHKSNQIRSNQIRSNQIKSNHFCYSSRLTVSLSK